MTVQKLERFEPLSKKQALEFYGKREIAQIPGDVLAIADRARALQTEVDSLRAQLLNSTIKNALISGAVAGLMIGAKSGVLAILDLLSK